MMMGEQQFGWNYFENEVVIGDKRDKKRMIVVVFSNFMCIPYNRKAFDELVDWLNEQDDELHKCRNENEELHITIFENDVWLTIEEIVETLNNQRNAILRYEYELYKLKKDNKQLKNKEVLNKKFRVRFEQEDGRGEIVNEKGVELTAREVVNYLNEMTTKCSQLEQKIKEKNKYQRVLEDKIRRLKDRIKVLEK